MILLRWWTLDTQLRFIADENSKGIRRYYENIGPSMYLENQFWPYEKGRTQSGIFATFATISSNGQIANLDNLKCSAID